MCTGNTDYRMLLETYDSRRRQYESMGDIGREEGAVEVGGEKQVVTGIGLCGIKDNNSDISDDDSSVNSKQSVKNKKNNAISKSKKTNKKTKKSIISEVEKIKIVVYGLQIRNKNILINKMLMDSIGYRKLLNQYFHISKNNNNSNNVVKDDNDDIIIMMALISSNSEIDHQDRATASAWLDLWDDSSIRYQYLCRRGVERSGSSYD